MKLNKIVFCLFLSTFFVSTFLKSAATHISTIQEDVSGVVGDVAMSIFSCDVTFSTPGISCVRFDPSGNCIAVGFYNGDIFIYDLTDKCVVRKIIAEDQFFDLSFDFGFGGFLALADSSSFFSILKLNECDDVFGYKRAVCLKPLNLVSDVRFNRGGNCVALQTLEKKSYVYDIQTQKVEVINERHRVLKLHPLISSVVGFVDFEGDICIRHLDANNVQYRITMPEIGKILDFDFAPDGKSIVAMTDNKLCMIKIGQQAPELVKVASFPNDCFKNLVFSNDGRNFAVLSEHKIYILDSSNLDNINYIFSDFKEDFCLGSLSFSSDGSKIMAVDKAKGKIFIFEDLVAKVNINKQKTACMRLAQKLASEKAPELVIKRAVQALNKIMPSAWQGVPGQPLVYPFLKSELRIGNLPISDACGCVQSMHV